MTESPDVRDGALREALSDRFGFAAFRPGQEEIAAAVLAGRDLVLSVECGTIDQAERSLAFLRGLPDTRVAL